MKLSVSHALKKLVISQYVTKIALINVMVLDQHVVKKTTDAQHN